MNDGGDDYPYNATARALEQLGWIKRDIEAYEKALEKLEKGMLTEADLLRMENRLIGRWSESLNTWWKYKPQEIDRQIDERIEAKAKSAEEAERLALAKQGKFRDEDGQIKSKVNPVIAFTKSRWEIIPIVLFGVYLWRPEWFGYLWQFTLRALF